jgi:GNAT superfamily N-acetyltransferase
VSHLSIEIITPSAEERTQSPQFFTDSRLPHTRDSSYLGFCGRMRRPLQAARACSPTRTAVVLAAVSANQYVIPERWGQGVGNCLHDAALQRAQRRGATTAWLEVLEQNIRARGFTGIVAGAWPRARVRKRRMAGSTSGTDVRSATRPGCPANAKALARRCEADRVRWRFGLASARQPPVPDKVTLCWGILPISSSQALARLRLS